LAENVSLRENPTVQFSEQHNWQLISEGDKQAYEHLFRAYYQSLCNYSCTLLKDMDEAEEVVQNVFYILWNKRESLQISGSLKSYIYRAVHNDSLNKIKHKKVRAVYADDYRSSVSATESGLQTLEAKELGKEINAAIDSLPEQCGVVFKLSRFEHLKYSEIAEQLNISIKTVENHMGKALKLLRARLKDYITILLCYLFL